MMYAFNKNFTIWSIGTIEEIEAKVANGRRKNVVICDEEGHVVEAFENGKKLEGRKAKKFASFYHDC